MYICVCFLNHLFQFCFTYCTCCLVRLKAPYQLPLIETRIINVARCVARERPWRRLFKPRFSVFLWRLHFILPHLKLLCLSLLLYCLCSVNLSQTLLPFPTCIWNSSTHFYVKGENMLVNITLQIFPFAFWCLPLFLSHLPLFIDKTQPFSISVKPLCWFVLGF